VNPSTPARSAFSSGVEAVTGTGAAAFVGAGAAAFGRGAGATTGVFGCCWEYPTVTTRPATVRAIDPIKALVVLMAVHLEGPAILVFDIHVGDLRSSEL
jgi:hypothetical protein